MARAASWIAAVLLAVPGVAGAADPPPVYPPSATDPPLVGFVDIRTSGSLSLLSPGKALLPGLRADLPVVPYDPAPELSPFSLEELRLGGKGWAERYGTFRPYAEGGLSLDFRGAERGAPVPLREWLGRAAYAPWLGLGADWQMGKNTVLTTEMRADLSTMDFNLGALERNAHGAQLMLGVGHSW